MEKAAWSLHTRGKTLISEVASALVKEKEHFISTETRDPSIAEPKGHKFNTELAPAMDAGIKVAQAMADALGAEGASRVQVSISGQQNPYEGDGIFRAKRVLAVSVSDGEADGDPELTG